MKRREQSQTEQLRRALAEREAQLQEARARLAALEGSTSLQVGRALAGAARQPARGLVRLPRELYRLWRGSSRSADPAQRDRARTPEPVRSYEAERQEARLLAGQPAFGDDRIAVAGVLSAEARAALAPYARIIPLRPHDVQVVFDSADVDLVLVTTSATRPGGPWAHAGDPAAVDRTRALRWVLEAAGARGVASILVRDTPAAPALAGLGFDHVHDGDLGVPLHRYHPIAAEPDRAAVPVRVSGTGRPPHPPVAGGGEQPYDADARWEELPDVLRAAATAVVDTPALADRALACGARVLLVGGRPGPGLPPAAVRTATGGTDLARAADEGPLTPGELRLALRSLFLTRATPVVLAELLGRVQLLPGGGTPTQPLAGRAVAVLACPLDDTESLALADDMLHQQHPPTEIVVPASCADYAGVQRLRARGYAVRTAADVDADPVDRWTPAGWARLAEAATAPWTALWDRPSGQAFLVDALCAAECSGADAVGSAVLTGGTVDRPVRDTDLGWAAAGQEYVFVNEVRPFLARRDLVRKGLHPGVWSRHGARLLALGDLRPAGHDAAPDHAHAG